jgi:hypothetical protein
MFSGVALNPCLIEFKSTGQVLNRANLLGFASARELPRKQRVISTLNDAVFQALAVCTRLESTQDKREILVSLTCRRYDQWAMILQDKKVCDVTRNP